MPSFSLQIEAPLAGIRRDTSYQKQPPYSCLDCLNLWPVDVRDGRRVLATRPALAAFSFPETPINLIGQLNLPAPTLFVGGNGKLYKRGATSWTQITSTSGASSGRPVDCTPFFKRLLIANSGAPLVYNDADSSLVPLVATAGTVPDDCRLAMTFAGAPWLAGSPDEPHVFSCGRTGDIFDWDTSREDEGGAFTSTGEFLGLITEPLTAMFAFTDDRAIFGCEQSTWVLSGHPRRGGRFDIVSSVAGVLGQWAWTRTPEGHLYYMSSMGLMRLHKTDFGTVVVTPVSQKQIPDELLGLPIDVFNPTVCLAYDSRWNALIITVRGEREQAWLYDLVNGGFSRMEFADYPTVMREFQPFVSEDTSGVLMGGESLLRFDRNAVEEMDTRAMIGPVKISETATRSSRIGESIVQLGGGTNDPDAIIRFHTGPTPHIAALRAESNSVNYRYEITAGSLAANGRRCYPQLTGHAMVLTLEQTASENRIVFDGSELVLSDGGRTRDIGLLPPVLTVPPTTVNVQAS